MYPKKLCGQCKLIEVDSPFSRPISLTVFHHNSNVKFQFIVIQILVKVGPDY